MSSSAAAAISPETEISLVPGQYVVVPKSGLCVVTGIKTMEFGGVSEEVMEFRALKNPAASIMKPTKRLQSAGLRLPVSTEEMQEILHGAFSAVKGDGGGFWHHRAADYQEQINSAHPSALAMALNKILSKYRSPKWKENKIDSDLPKDGQVSISYSERQLGNSALDHLGFELSHVTGMTVPEARRTILRAALVQDFAGKLELSNENAPGPKMDVEAFKNVFGFTPGETPTGATIKIASIRQAGGATYARPQGQIGHRRVSNDTGAPRAAGSFFSGKTIYDPTKDLQGDYLDLYKAEARLVPTTGTVRLLFRHAPRTLDMELFGVYAKMDLRERESRQRPEQIARETGKSVNDVIAMRNKAADQVSALLKRLGLPNVKHSAVRPYKQTVQKEKQLRAEPVIPEANRALYHAEMDNVPTKGMMKKLFLVAAQTLAPEEFRVFTQTQIRRNTVRQNYETLAAAMELPVDDIIALRDRAAEKLKQTGKFSAGRGTLKILEPYAASVEKAPKPPKPPKPPRLSKEERLLQSIPEGNRSLFRAEEASTAPKGSMRRIFLAAAKSLNNWEFQIVAQTALRRGNRLTMQQAAEAMDLPLEDAIKLRNGAMEKLIVASGQNPDRPRAPKFFRPYTGEKPVKAPKPPKPPKPPKEPVDIAAGVPAANRPVFDQELQNAPVRGIMRGLFMTAARVLEPSEFEILMRTKLRRLGLRESMHKAADALGMDVAEAIRIHDVAAEKVVSASSYDLTKPRAPKILVPYDPKPVFARAAKGSGVPKNTKTVPKTDRAIGAAHIGFAEVGDETVVIIRVPRAAMENSYGLKLDVSWDRAVSGAPEILKAEGGIKSKRGAHAARGSAELDEPEIQPPPRTLDPS